MQTRLIYVQRDWNTSRVHLTGPNYVYIKEGTVPARENGPAKNMAIQETQCCQYKVNEVARIALLSSDCFQYYLCRQ